MGQTAVKFPEGMVSHLVEESGREWLGDVPDLVVVFSRLPLESASESDHDTQSCQTTRKRSRPMFDVAAKSFQPCSSSRSAADRILQKEDRSLTV